MNDVANNMTSFRPYHPGELLKDEFEYRKIQQKEFAKKFELSYTVLNETLNAKRPVSIEFALLVEAALGIDADMLVRMQTEYDLQVARQSEKIATLLQKIKNIAAVL